jgi:DNA-binding beta-propeller fold protein YncE
MRIRKDARPHESRRGRKLGAGVALTVLGFAGFVTLAVYALASGRSNSVAPDRGAARAISAEPVAAPESGMECLPVQAAQSLPAGRHMEDISGGDIPAVRCIADPYPEFSGVAGDSADGRVVFGDGSRKSLLIYRLTDGSGSPQETQPLQRIMGPQTNVGFISSVAIDPATGDYFAVNNDTEDRIAVFSRSADGNALPLRVLYTPHQAYGLSLDAQHRELATTVQQLNAVLIYRLQAKGLEAPLRVIQGPATHLADPHGVFVDSQHNEIVVANIGNYRPGGGFGAPYAKHFGPLLPSQGKFLAPSLTFFARDAKGNEAPLRTLQGPDTRLNWPMAITEDVEHGELAVANNGDNSILIFGRTEKGDAKPVRIIRGPHTGLDLPLGVYIDTRHDELWVSNFGNHSATVYPRQAEGDVAPLRIIRNAPLGTPTAGLGNPMAIAFNPGQQEILVAN